jgi:putative membrane protein
MSDQSRAFLWLCCGVFALYVPIIGAMLASGMSFAEAHPALNGTINGTALVFIIAGRVAIHRGDRDFHRKAMLGAFAASTVFLISYLARTAYAGTTRYPGSGADKIIYLFILFTHMILAAIVVPMVLRTLYLGLKGRLDKHSRLARWTFPIWLYVSATGVMVYLLLHPIANALYR